MTVPQFGTGAPSSSAVESLCMTNEILPHDSVTVGAYREGAVFQTALALATGL
ncbi:hypothetical protein LMG23994_07190 [Cupriavidus pinatubonensis]|uniref:Uncharacterized protein n=1 Tax=Cupriavidus pinatubonensis TaxID=248026 RepID=A0ABM8Y4P5_9BURK|nr:hypothetical protein LMG23994_07190 [Cupriavidus pinatubonensis]